jgi:hypothetical protein
VGGGLWGDGVYFEVLGTGREEGGVVDVVVGGDGWERTFWVSAEAESHKPLLHFLSRNT